MTGETSETTLPVSSNAYQKTIKPGPTCVCNSGFLLELDGAGQNVLAATYLEGTPPLGNDGANFSGIALDSHSNVYVGGWNGSSDFPLQNPFVSVLEYTESSSEMVLAGVNSDMSTLLFGSFLSSTDQTPAGSTFSGLAVDYQDNLIITGGTQATDFPTTSGAFQTVPPAQGNHPFVAKLNMAVAAPSVCLDTWTVNFGQVLVGTSITETVHLTNCGNAALNLSLIHIWCLVQFDAHRLATGAAHGFFVQRQRALGVLAIVLAITGMRHGNGDAGRNWFQIGHVV